MKTIFNSSLAVIILLAIAPGITAQKSTPKSSGTSSKPNTTVSRPSVPKPPGSSATAPRPSVSATGHSPSATTSPADRNNNYNDPLPQPEKPTALPDPQPTNAKPVKDHYGSSETHNGSTPSTDGDETGTETNTVNDNRDNYPEINQPTFCRREYRRDWNQKHCGCAGEIVFVNMTGDTLNIFLRWVSAERLPLAGGSMPEQIEANKLIPDFRLLPGEETSVLNRCRGGVLYEAMVKGRRKDNKGIWRGSVRFACTGSIVLFNEENRD